MAKRLTLLLASSMTIMAGAAIAPALPAIEAAFRGQPHATLLVQFLLTLTALFTALSAPVWGLAVDRLGRKPALVAATLLYGLAGGSGLVLMTLPSLLVGRALLGVAVAGIMTAATTLIADYYQGDKRSQVISQQSVFMAYGGLIFQLSGGILADINWRYPFIVYLLAFGVTGMAMYYIREPQKANLHRNIALSSTEQPKFYPTQRHTIIFIYALMFLSMVAFYLLPIY